MDTLLHDMCWPTPNFNLSVPNIKSLLASTWKSTVPNVNQVKAYKDSKYASMTARAYEEPTSYLRRI